MVIKPGKKGLLSDFRQCDTTVITVITITSFDTYFPLFGLPDLRTSFTEDLISI